MKHPIPTVKETSNFWRWLILFAIAATVIGVLWSINEEQDRTDSGLAPGVIYDTTTRIVTQDLKAPATAKFPSFHFDERAVEFRSLGNKRYSIKSYVDSQNAFGAMIRTRWTAIVSVSDRTVKVESLKTDP